MVLIGRAYVKMGRTTSLSNNIYLDIARGHVVYIVGKRGCLTENTKVFTNHGYKNIKDFNPKKDKIYSFNGKKFEWEKAKLLKYKVEGENLIELENYDGQKLIMTQEHPLLVFQEGKKIWKKAEDLKENDSLISVSRVPEVKNDSESLRIARLLGFILADGTMQARKGRFKDGRGAYYTGTKRRVRIINGSEDVLRTAKEDLEKEFKGIISLRKKGKENCFVVQSSHRKVLEKFNSLGIPLGLKSHIIRVPDIVFESSNEFKRQFIRALFSCDGYVNKDGLHVAYYSKSRKFLEDLNLILAHFKIQSTIRDKIVKLNGKVFHNYQMYVTDHTSLENFKKIGFVDKSKIKKLSKHKFWTAIRRKSTVYLDNNLFCNRIKKIEKISNIKEVYDLQVSKNHSFLANGVISHNSGKSYTMGAIAEGVMDLPDDVRKNLSMIMFDTMGVYWTMKYPNQKDEDLLEQWGMKGRGMDVKIYTPYGFFQKYKDDGIPTDHPFSIKASDLTSQDWILSFELKESDPVAIVIEKTIGDFLEMEKSVYNISDLIDYIHHDESFSLEIRNEAINRFRTAERWGLFSDDGMNLMDLVKPGEITVMDLSPYVSTEGGWGVKALVIGLIGMRVFSQRMLARKAEELETINVGYSYFQVEEEISKKEPLPIVWLVVDEAHEFLPREGKTAATDALVIIMREGRQPGVSLILASQQPGKIHTDVMSQSDIVISHRLTAKPDVDALATMSQSYMSKSLPRMLDELPRVKGCALLLDDSSERFYEMQIRPRLTWHGGAAPTAIKYKRKLELGL